MQIGLVVHGNYPKWAWKIFFSPQNYKAGVLILIYKANSVLTVSVSIWKNVIDFWEFRLGLH